MVRISLILFFGAAALAGTVMPWDAAQSAQTGIARIGCVGLLPVIAAGGAMLLLRRRGAIGWLLAALLGTACFPLRVVVAKPDHLLTAMAARLGKADAAYLWTSPGLAVGKLPDGAPVPEMGTTPCGFTLGAIEWLSPGYWLTIFGLSALLLAALTGPRRGSRWWAVSGQMASGCGALILCGWLFAAYLLAGRWDGALAALARPATSGPELAKAVAFVDAYPPALLNRTFQTLLLRPAVPLRPELRTELELLAKEWPQKEAPALLARLPEPGEGADAGRLASLRRLWWGPTLRGWIKDAPATGDYHSAGMLAARLGDQPVLAMWTLAADYFTGRWDRALAAGERLCADPAYTRYQPTIWNLQGTLYTRLGMPDKAREPWLSSFTAEPSNNDPAIRGLGTVGP